LLVIFAINLRVSCVSTAVCETYQQYFHFVCFILVIYSHNWCYCMIVRSWCWLRICWYAKMSVI